MTENLVLQSMHLLAGVLTHKVMTKVLQGARDTMDEETRVRLAELWLEELRALGGVPLGKKRPRAVPDGGDGDGDGDSDGDGDGDGNGSTRTGVRRRLRSNEAAIAAKEASRHRMLRDKVASIQHHRGCMGVPVAVMAPPVARRPTATGLFQSEVMVKLAQRVSADTTTTTTTTMTTTTATVANTNTNTNAEAEAARSSSEMGTEEEAARSLSEVGTGPPPAGIWGPSAATRPRRAPVQGHHLLGAQVDVDMDDPDPARRYARIVKMTAGYRKIPATVRVRFLDGSDMQLPWGGPHSARLSHEQSAEWETLVRRNKGMQELEPETESDAGREGEGEDEGGSGEGRDAASKGNDKDEEEGGEPERGPGRVREDQGDGQDKGLSAMEVDASDDMYDKYVAQLMGIDDDDDDGNDKDKGKERTHGKEKETDGRGDEDSIDDDDDDDDDLMAEFMGLDDEEGEDAAGDVDGRVANVLDRASVLGEADVPSFSSGARVTPSSQPQQQEQEEQHEERNDGFIGLSIEMSADMELYFDCLDDATIVLQQPEPCNCDDSLEPIEDPSMHIATPSSLVVSPRAVSASTSRKHRQWHYNLGPTYVRIGGKDYLMPKAKLRACMEAFVGPEETQLPGPVFPRLPVPAHRLPNT